MSRMLSKMNLISVVQQLPKEDIETIQGYVEMIEQENNVQKAMIENFVKENQSLKKQIEEYKYSHSCSFVDICKSTKIANYNQQKEFIEMLEKEIVDSKAGSGQQYYAKEHLRLFKEIIGGKDGN